VIEMNDDDWELFVPVRGEKWPYGTQSRLRAAYSDKWYPLETLWYTNIVNPLVNFYEFRRPKQKETKVPDRTRQQALKDAIDSGAVEAWINGEDVQWSHTYEEDWIPDKGSGFGPCWMDNTIKWRPKPPEPTKINWQPVVTGKEPQEEVLAYWGPRSVHIAVFKDGHWRNPHTYGQYTPPAFYAPMCNLPEGDE